MTDCNRDQNLANYNPDPNSNATPLLNRTGKLALALALALALVPSNYEVLVQLRTLTLTSSLI